MKTDMKLFAQKVIQRLQMSRNLSCLTNEFVRNIHKSINARLHFENKNLQVSDYEIRLLFELM